MNKVFVSHASADWSVVDKFVDLLLHSLGLIAPEIFCTSADGLGIETGRDFVDKICESLRDSSLVILLLSPNYYASKFCIAEMGAAWALGKDVFPLVFLDLDRDPGVVLLGRQSDRIDSRGLDNLRDRLARYWPSASERTARWTLKRDEFLRTFEQLLPTLPVPATISKERLTEETEKLEEAMTLYREEQEKNRILTEKYEALKQVKDRKAAEVIERKFSNVDERYAELVKKVQNSLQTLGLVEQRCVYASIKREPWIPSVDAWDGYTSEIQAAKDRERIYDSGDDRHSALEANATHPKMKPILKTIRDLAEFLDPQEEYPSAALTDFLSELEKRYQCPVHIENREYWEEVLLERNMLE